MLVYVQFLIITLHRHSFLFHSSRVSFMFFVVLINAFSLYLVDQMLLRDLFAPPFPTFRLFFASFPIFSSSYYFFYGVRIHTLCNLKITQPGHPISERRCMDVRTTSKRYNDVVTTSFVRRERLIQQTFYNSNTHRELEICSRYII